MMTKDINTIYPECYTNLDRCETKELLGLMHWIKGFNSTSSQGICLLSEDAISPLLVPKMGVFQKVKTLR